MAGARLLMLLVVARLVPISDILDVAVNHVVVLLHCNGKLFLVIVEERGVGDDDEGNFETESFQDGTGACY